MPQLARFGEISLRLRLVAEPAVANAAVVIG